MVNPKQFAKDKINYARDKINYARDNPKQFAKDKINYARDKINYARDNIKGHDIKFLFSIALYFGLLLLFYFKGVKKNGNGKNKSSDIGDLTAFIVIIIYILNGYILYSYTNDNSGSVNKILIQFGLFYLLNIIILYHSFSPSEQAPEYDSSGNQIPNKTKDNNSGVFLGFSVVGFIAYILSILTFLPRFKGSIPKGFWSNSIKLLLIVLIFFGLISMSIYFFSYTAWPLTIIMNILNISIMIGLLAMVFLFLKDKFNVNNKPGENGSWLMLIKFLIFYIPCLFIDLINYIKQQIDLTTPTVWLILLLQIITIGLRILLPIVYKQYNRITSVHGDVILKKPVYTNVVTDLGIFQNHSSSNLVLSKLNKTAIFNYNYALSCWIWINPQPPSTSDAYSKSTTLLNYGDVLKINFNQDKIEIFAATTEDNVLTEQLIKIYELKNIQYQKWNNFVLNYSGGTLDIFINNHLVSSNINITPVMYYNRITSGSDNGIQGGIKDIVYYDKVLTQREINSIYNQ